MHHSESVHDNTPPKCPISKHQEHTDAHFCDPREFLLNLKSASNVHIDMEEALLPVAKAHSIKVFSVKHFKLRLVAGDHKASVSNTCLTDHEGKSG